MPWGSHFCLFYETKQDLLDTLSLYCKAGLEAGEFCLWIVADPLTTEQATNALRNALPDFDRTSIEIIAAADWYREDGSFDLQRVTNRWLEKLARAMARGYAGVRVTGDTAWLTSTEWKNFCEYEDGLNEAIANERLTALCTYPIAACGAAEVIDVVRTHQVAVIKRQGEWEVIETAGLKQAKAEINRLNEELESRVLERTRELTAANEALEHSTGRLISAQEDERSRIARELHDHISQMLGLLTIKIERLKIDPAFAPAIVSNLEEVRRGVTDVADEIRSLSHRLHSSTLEYHGLAPALARLAADFSTRHGISIHFAHRSLPTALPSAVALTLFRVAEEGLTNIARHSQARSAQIDVSGVADGIHLTVHDDGVGFDTTLPRRKGGLGFVSMQERLRVLHGTLRVDSAPGQGTNIDAWIPSTSLTSSQARPA